MSRYRKYGRTDQKWLARGAADWAERVLPYFEQSNPGDERPRRAVGACRAWVETGLFKMADIRAASLGAHAAARETKGGDAARFAARAAGQAVATAHVAQHAFGAAYYALKAVVAASGEQGGAKALQEREWQALRLPEPLRPLFLAHVLVQNAGRRVTIKIDKGEGF